MARIHWMSCASRRLYQVSCNHLKGIGPTICRGCHSASPRQAIVYDRTRLRPLGMPRVYALPRSRLHVAAPLHTC